jgi:hypothetical protein
MPNQKWISFVLLVGSGLLALPAVAQVPNQSDLTGTNVWNNPVPVFRNNGQLKPEILDNARSLDQQLGDASNRCCNATESTSPRRFARGLRDPNEVCINPDCQQLNGLIDQTKVFLGEVNRLQEEQQRVSRNRAW